MPLQALKRQGRCERWRMPFLAALLLWYSPRGKRGQPYLELDTKGHMTLIRSIAFTSDGSQLISASDDKTIRVWDVATGRIVRTIRGEIGDGDPGKIYALARSRDGRLLAAGGRTGATGQGQPIRLYDLSEGTLIGLLQGHDDAVLARLLARRRAPGVGQLRRHRHHLGRCEPQSASPPLRP